MKRITFSFLFVFPAFAFAQTLQTDIANAEKNFAAYSVQNGTRAAFLKFADANGIVFEKGKPVNAIETWSKRTSAPGILNWRPIYALTAASGELGFTTGPWTFQPKSIQDSIVARGQYSTIWHKTPTGEWKFLLDMGVGDTPAFDSLVIAADEKNFGFTPGSIEDLQKAEDDFIRNTSDPTSRRKAYVDAVSENTFLLNRNGQLPTISIDKIGVLMQSMPDTITYKLLGSGIAKSGDFGYVYGSAIDNDKESNYLRVWRKENKTWKLVLEVLQY